MTTGSNFLKYIFTSFKLSTKGGLSPDPTIMDTPGPAGTDACEFKFGITNHLFKNKIQPQLYKGTDKLLIYCILLHYKIN